MSIALGVDGGATKTMAFVADETGTILGQGSGGPSNHQGVGPDAAIAEIERAARGALTMAELERADVACFALGGADFPIDYRMLTERLAPIGLAERFRVVNDTLAMVRAGLSRSWGVGVVCGTGSNFGGFAPDGTHFQFYDIGPLSGDWGGASDLGEEVLFHVARACDGRGRPTLMTDLLLEKFGFPTYNAFLEKLYIAHVPHYDAGADGESEGLHVRIATLAPLVFQAARRGDAVAQEIVVRQGEEIGISVGAVARRLGLEKTDTEVVLGGGVFKSRSALLIETSTRKIREFIPQAQIVLLEAEPASGAVFLALESAGVEVTEDVRAKVQAYRA